MLLLIESERHIARMELPRKTKENVSHGRARNYPEGQTPNRAINAAALAVHPREIDIQSRDPYQLKLASGNGPNIIRIVPRTEQWAEALLFFA